MGLYRISLSGDNWITTESVSGNGGKDPVLNVAAKYVKNDGLKYISRILGIADFSSNSDVISKINSGYIPNPNLDTTVTATLKMFNVLHSELKAVSFNLNIHQVTSEWDEGSGIGFNEGNDLLMTGYANYKQRKANTNWTTSGGDYYNISNSATQSFDTGDEDLSVDITSMVKDWISGASSNYGFIIKMTDDAENLTGSTSASIDYFRKSLYARETHSLKWPRIEIVWDDQIQDRRNIFTIGNSGYLYFYNIYIYPLNLVLMLSILFINLLIILLVFIGFTSRGFIGIIVILFNSAIISDIVNPTSSWSTSSLIIIMELASSSVISITLVES